MKIDSNKLGSKVFKVCNECGKHALTLPENKGKYQYSISTWHTAVCDICGERKPVTEPRDFMYPVFERIEKPVVFTDTRDNFHPYECGGNDTCVHCRGDKTQAHDPSTCALCNFDKED